MADKPTILPVISLFSGAMGLDLGIEAASSPKHEGRKFEVRVAVECNPYAAKTIETNLPDLPLVSDKIEKVTTDQILGKAGLKKGEAALVVGGPSCQSFSTAGKRASVGVAGGMLFEHFCRVVEEARPRFFVMENVRGLLSAAVKHRPLAERGPGYPALEPDEELGSAFLVILKRLRKLGYYVVFDVLNSADFGVPQVRERVVFIGSRDGELVRMPTPTHSKVPRDGILPWVTLREALKGIEGEQSKFVPFPPAWSKYLKKVPEGGNWRNLTPVDQKEALGAAYVSWGGRVGFYRRLSWDKPSPALTTKPASKGTMQCHPTETRSLSISEYREIQQFPKRWSIEGPLAQQYLQLGNAVPVGLGTAIGNAILETMSDTSRVDPVSQIICASQVLLDRMGKRPKTQLNPPRMLKSQDPAKIREWRQSCHGCRDTIVEYLDNVPKSNNKSNEAPQTTLSEAEHIPQEAV